MSFRGVAISGRAGSGKTTLADALVAAGLVRERVSFAAALKDDLALLDAHKGDPGFRELAQVYGTDFARAKYGEDHWPERLLQSLGGSLEGVAIDDVRFPNESRFAVQHELLLVRLTGMTDEMQLERIGAVSDHESERALVDEHYYDLWVNCKLPVERIVAFVAGRLAGDATYHFAA